MDFQATLLSVISVTLILSLLQLIKIHKKTVTIEVHLTSSEKSRHNIPESTVTCSKQCTMELLPEKGMYFNAAGIGPASISAVVVSDTYFTKIVCELSLSRDNGDFEDAVSILKSENWNVQH